MQSSPMVASNNNPAWSCHALDKSKPKSKIFNDRKRTQHQTSIPLLDSDHGQQRSLWRLDTARTRVSMWSCHAPEQVVNSSRKTNPSRFQLWTSKPPISIHRQKDSRYDEICSADHEALGCGISPDCRCYRRILGVCEHFLYGTFW